MDMDKICYKNCKILFLILIFFQAVNTSLTNTEDSCEESLEHTYAHQDNFFYIWWIQRNYGTTLRWLNMSSWDGRLQIPGKENLSAECFITWGDLLALTEKHPDIEDINENTIEVQACVLNEERNCIWNTYVYMKKCNGNLLYSFPSFNESNPDASGKYICLDRIYTDTSCKAGISIQTDANGHSDILEFSPVDQYGWLDASIGRKQFVFPSLEDMEKIFVECLLSKEFDWHYFLQEPLPDEIGEDPVRLAVCYVYLFDGSFHTSFDDNGNCAVFIYVRSCSGKLQFDLTGEYLQRKSICLIHYNNVKVQPEISHEETTFTENDKKVIFYTSSLQYRCSFDAEENKQYKTNWYINGTLQVQTAPSSNINDMVFNAKYLASLKHGYEVTCGVFPADENETMEATSDVYYAGWKVISKISDKDIILSKSGIATITIEQTIPLGCNYRADNVENCIETMSFEDPINNADDCSCRIEVKSSDDPIKPLVEIKSLKKGEMWTKKKYTAILSSVDSDYDDKTAFDLQLVLTYNSFRNAGKPVISSVVGEIHVDITDTNRHWNKRCYSHVDPHMKTVDGIHYEAQREGDYMLYMNEKFQTEVQTSARYCSPGYTGGPVCACGIAIAVGADLFVINRCHDKPFKFDLSCRDGGLIDIERIHDYRYLVRTPIGTLIEISLLWSHLMNIDVYMSAKDFKNTAGLCGKFDGDRSNDLEHRDGTISDDFNRSYKFADSWRLTDEENLFINTSRKLDHWNENNIGRTCTRTNSITRKKCKISKRQRRSVPKHSEIKMSTYYQHLKSRKKRGTNSLTEDEAFLLCNHSIYTTPAVQEFPDHLAEEDPDIVVEQCVYDLTQGNDTTWIDAHVSVLNSAADTILRMNPVYVANNIDKVKAFRVESCLNNCSGNGICADTGLCACNGIFRGPDCSIDISIPPVVFEIEGGELCTIKDEDDCTCFQIRTNNIFDGFVCNITEIKVYSNGSRMEGNSSTALGYYEDIFTGECCVLTATRNNSFDFNDTDKLSITMYKFSISNDGVNYGDANSVFINDKICLEYVNINDEVTFMLKKSYCFIAATCVLQNFKMFDNDTCFICNPSNDPYGWTEYDCKDSGSYRGLEPGAIVGIVIGSTIIVVVVCVVIYLFAPKILKKNSSSIGVQPKAWVSKNNLGIKSLQQSDGKYHHPAKPKFQQSMMIDAAHHPNQCVKYFSAKESDMISAKGSDMIHRELDRVQLSATPNNSKPKRDISYIDIELD